MEDYIMNRSENKSIWNRSKGETSNEEEESLEDEWFDDEAAEQEMIARVQMRLGVSRERARNIIKNSKLM